MAASVLPDLDPFLQVPTVALTGPSLPGLSTDFQVIRRSGELSDFDASKISVAITKAFIAVEGTTATSSRRIHDAVEDLTRQIVEALSRRTNKSRALHIEDIQDQVELALMRSGEHKVARAYVLYRAERAEQRRQHADVVIQSVPGLTVRLASGEMAPLDEFRLQRELQLACKDLDGVSADAVMSEVRRNLYDGILEHELGLAQTMAARALIEQEPNYAYVSARLLLNILRDEALTFLMPEAVAPMRQAVTIDYNAYFPTYIRRAI